MSNKGREFRCYSRNLKPVMQWKIEAVLPYISQACDADQVIFDG